jgi:hypothetical protein
MAKFSVLLSLLVVALVALSTTAFAPQPAFGKLILIDRSKNRIESDDVFFLSFELGAETDRAFF